MNVLGKYGGFITVFLEWGGFLTGIALVGLNFHEPVSQLGYYPQTKLLFGATFTLASIVYYLFSRNLNKYWQYTSFFSLLAGICLIITGWIPYQPHVQKFVFDIHNTAILCAFLLYALPMIFIGYKKAHASIAKYSRIGFLAVTVVGGGSVVARIVGSPFVLLLQVLAASCLHVWLIAVNRLLLKDYEHPLAKKL